MSLLLKSKGFRIGLALLILAILLAIYPWSYSLYKLRSTQALPSTIKKQLISSAALSLLHSDVPVGAVITYNDSIIGIGYNTVRKDTVAFGHAEINALTAALKKTGLDAFHALDRNKLCLYTTLEPCEMCKGAIVEYRIKHVRFMKAKDMVYWYRERNWEYLYEYHKTQIEGEVLQDSLLNLHPGYNKE